MRLFAAFCLAVVLPTAAVCQYYPYHPGYGYNPYNRGYRNPYAYRHANALSGAADVINAQGNFRIQNEQAAKMREERYSMMLDQRKKLFDQRLYEASKTPTPEQKRQMALVENERRIENDLRESLNDPPLTSITSGKALNALLPTLKEATYTSYGAQVPLDPEVLKQINVNVTTGNPSALRTVSNLNWPLALRGAGQQKVDQLFAQAVRNAKEDKPDRQVLSSLNKELNALKDALGRGVEDGSVDFREFSEASTFLRNVGESVKLLQQTDAGKYFDGTYEAKGRSANELVQYMTNHGLKFAPAQAGQESCYLALHTQLVRYAKSSFNSGFRLRLGLGSAGEAKE